MSASDESPAARPRSRRPDRRRRPHGRSRRPRIDQQRRPGGPLPRAMSADVPDPARRRASRPARVSGCPEERSKPARERAGPWTAIGRAQVRPVPRSATVVITPRVPAVPPSPRRRVADAGSSSTIRSTDGIGQVLEGRRRARRGNVRRGDPDDRARRGCRSASSATIEAISAPQPSSRGFSSTVNSRPVLRTESRIVCGVERNEASAGR